MNVHNLVIEITARCNMRCAHCMRGDARHEDISGDVIDAVARNINYASNLTITGGEPGLRPRIMQNLLSAFQARGVAVGDFYIVTNAKRVTREFECAVDAWLRYCEDNEVSGVAVSSDHYHDASSAAGVCRLEDICESHGVEFDRKNNANYVKAIGRGEYVCNTGTPSRLGLGYHIEDYDSYFEVETLVVDRHGRMLSDCDYSFDETDEPGNSAGSILDDDPLGLLLKWNESHP